MSTQQALVALGQMHAVESQKNKRKDVQELMDGVGIATFRAMARARQEENICTIE